MTNENVNAAKEQTMKTTIPKLRKMIRKVISESSHGYGGHEGGSMASGQSGLGSDMETNPVLAKAYEEGFEQGRHDSTDDMESELHPYAFNSTEEYEAFKAGYEDAMYG